MKSRKKASGIAVRDYFSGWRSIGNSVKTSRSSVESHQRYWLEKLSYIERQASLLLKASSSGVEPESLQLKAANICSLARRAKELIFDEDFSSALDCGIELGALMEQTKSLQLALGGLNEIKKSGIPRRLGGESTAKLKKAGFSRNQEKAVAIWLELSKGDKPERERVAIIARRLELKPDTVQRYIQKAGLRKKGGLR